MFSCVFLNDRLVFRCCSCDIASFLGPTSHIFVQGPPLLSKSAFSATQLAYLDQLNGVLREDYVLRQQMLLQRVDLTVQSFLWSDKAKVSSFPLYFLVLRNLRV